MDGKDRVLETQWGRNGLLTAGGGQLRTAPHKVFEHKHMGTDVKKVNVKLETLGKLNFWYLTMGEDILGLQFLEEIK